MLFLTYEASIRYLRDPAKDPNEDPDLRCGTQMGFVGAMGADDQHSLELRGHIP
jgi:hypothetical protein